MRTKDTPRTARRRGPVVQPDRTATKAVLVAAHLCAAAIIIPILGRRLTAVDHDHESSGNRPTGPAAGTVSAGQVHGGDDTVTR